MRREVKLDEYIGGIDSLFEDVISMINDVKESDERYDSRLIAIAKTEAEKAFIFWQGVTQLRKGPLDKEITREHDGMV